MRLLRASAVLIGVLGFAVTPAHANLVTNGSFELGSFTGATFDTLLSGSTAITGWTVGGDSVDWIGSYWQSSDGVRDIDLSGNGAGSVAATTALATDIGTDYALTFDLAGNPDGGPTVKTLKVTIAGGVPTIFNFDTTGATHGNMGWLSKTLYFTATGTTTTLDFASGDATAYGPALDNVAVNAVPEPASLLLLGTGLSALVRARRRKA